MADKDTLTDRQKAAQEIMDGERTALTAIKDHLTDFDASLGGILADLGLPNGFPSNAVRIINEIRANQAFRLQTELPNLIQAITPVPPVTPTP